MEPKLRTTLHILSENAQLGDLPSAMMGVDICLLDPAKPVPASVEILLADIDLRNPHSVDKIRAFRHVAQPHTQIFFTVNKGDRQNWRQACALGARKTVLKPLSEIGIAIVIEKLRSPHRFVTKSKTTIIETSARMLREIFEQATQQQPIDTDTIGETTCHIAESVADLGVLDWLDTVRIYHHSTFQHVLLVTGIACAFGQGIGMNAEDIAKLTQAGLLHDIGKVWIPAEILDKTGKLTPEEFEIVKRHPKDGYQQLMRQGSIHPDILDAVLHHHEYLDGSGYPDGLVEHEIPDLTRILTICDIMGALLERRAYKRAFSVQEALAVLFKMADQGKVEKALVIAMAEIFDCALSEIRLPENDMLDRAPS